MPAAWIPSCSLPSSSCQNPRSVLAASPSLCSYVHARCQPRPLQPTPTAVCTPIISPCSHISAHQQTRSPHLLWAWIWPWPFSLSCPAVGCLQLVLVVKNLHDACPDSYHQPPPPYMHLQLAHAVPWLHANNQGSRGCSCSCNWLWLLLVPALTTVCVYAVSQVYAHHWFCPPLPPSPVPSCWTWRCSWEPHQQP